MKNYISQVGLLLLMIILLSGCNTQQAPKIDLEENQQVLYLYEDAYGYMDVMLKQNPDFTSKTLESFVSTLEGDFDVALQEYFDTYKVMNADTDVLLTSADYDEFKDYQITVFDVLGLGYITSYGVPGKIVAMGSSAVGATYTLKNHILEVENPGDSGLITILYKNESKDTTFKKVELDHAYYELAHNGNLKRFAAYLLEDDLFYLGNDATLGQVVEYYYEGNYASFAEQVSLIYVANDRRLNVDEIMQDSGAKLEVFQPEGRTTYIRVPGELLFVNEEVTYTIEGEYIVIEDNYLGDVMIGYYEVDEE